MRALAAAISLFLLATPVLSASPPVEAAIKVFLAVGADANKMKKFCEMMKLEEQMGDKADPALEAQIAKLAAEIGADFKVAWDLAEVTDESTDDGKALNAAVDQLAGKCVK
jgi:hypothetical protein